GHAAAACTGGHGDRAGALPSGVDLRLRSGPGEDGGPRHGGRGGGAVRAARGSARRGSGAAPERGGRSLMADAAAPAAVKPKVAFYWCASCGGCEEAVVDLAEAILDVVGAVGIAFLPVALDFKRHG